MFSLLGLLLSTPNVNVPADSPLITINWLEDTRVHVLGDGTGYYARPINKLHLMTDVSGFNDQRAHWIGKWRIDEATDDLGNDLRLPDKDMDGDLKQVNYKFKKSRKVEAGLDLKSPPRNATKLVRLRGALEVWAGGESKVATFPKFKSLIGKKWDDPVLKEAGLEVELLPPDKDAKPNIFEIKLIGNLEALEPDRAVEVVDGSRHSITGSQFGGLLREIKGIQRWYTLDRAPSDDMTIKINVLLGQQKVDVKFDLKDIRLP